MGSDLYMEQQNWRQRPNRAEWDGDHLVIYLDRFYHGFTEVWRGVPTDDNLDLIKIFIKDIPEKPAPVSDPYDVITDVLKRVVLARRWCTEDANEIYLALQDKK